MSDTRDWLEDDTLYCVECGAAEGHRIGCVYEDEDDLDGAADEEEDPDADGDEDD